MRNLQVRANAGLHDHVLACISNLNIRTDDLILDYGAGSGAFLQRLVTKGYSNLHGADILKPSSINGIKQFHAIDLDQTSIDIESNSVKLIVTIEVIEHVENPGFFLGEISRIIASDGVVLLTTPNIHSIQAKTRFLLSSNLKQFDKISDPTHLYPVHLFTFERLLARHGLQIKKSWGFPVDGSSPTTSSIPLKLLSRLLPIAGVRGAPQGDHLCLLISRNTNYIRQSKAITVASHYG